MDTLTETPLTEQEAARQQLRELIKPGETLYTMLKHVSRSGMKRVVDVYRMQDNEPLRISWSVAKAAGFTYDKKHEGVTVSGCGLDVGFEVVSGLSMALFCPDKYDHDAAYSLKHRWL
jgi:hypothetical protein